jgi:hypothetical protein
MPNSGVSCPVREGFGIPANASGLRVVHRQTFRAPVNAAGARSGCFKSVRDKPAVLPQITPNNHPSEFCFEKQPEHQTAGRPACSLESAKVGWNVMREMFNRWTRTLEKYFLEVIYKQRTGCLAETVRSMLFVCSKVFHLAAKARR